MDRSNGFGLEQQQIFLLLLSRKSVARHLLSICICSPFLFNVCSIYVFSIFTSTPIQMSKHLRCTQRYKCRNRRTLITITPPSTTTTTTTTTSSSTTCSSFKNSTPSHTHTHKSILWIKNRFVCRVGVFTPFFLPSLTHLSYCSSLDGGSIWQVWFISSTALLLLLLLLLLLF